MDEIERQIRRKLRDNFPHYASKCLIIRDKTPKLADFVLNRAQFYLHELAEKQKRETGRVRIIVVKGRQQGISTYIGGRYFHQSTQGFGKQVFILTHEDQATNNLFNMVKRFYEHCPKVVRPQTKASNAKELVFSILESGYMLGTAGNKSVGRSSTINLFHGSEVAYWPHAEEHARGILESVPTHGSEIFLESTAEGIGNYFHDQWQQAEAGATPYLPVFIPWYWQAEYRLPVNPGFSATIEEDELKRIYGLSDEQIIWRREKIAGFSAHGLPGDRAFRTQYPFTSVEAFQSPDEDNFIPAELVVKARNNECEPYGPLLIGCDPARFGDDRTSIIRRRGRVAYGLESYIKKDTMEVAGILHRIIKNESPSKVFIDVGGLGAGVYDRLKELGHGDIIVAVNSGNTPLDQERYINLRGEMWGLMRDWLQDAPVQIPNIDSLHADLCGIKYRWDSKTRLILERKEDMKKRGVRSPDEAEALALTFVMPEEATFNKRAQEDETIAREVMSGFNTIDRMKKSAYR